MTGSGPQAHEAVSGTVRRISSKTVVLASLGAALLLVLNMTFRLDPRWWFLPASVIFGGALGLVNFRWLAVAVERIYLRKDAGPTASRIAAFIIHFIKLSAIFVVLFAVIKWKFVNVIGLVAGLSLCFFAIIWEGLIMMRRAGMGNQRTRGEGMEE